MKKQIWQQVEQIYHLSCADNFITFLQENPFCVLRTILGIPFVGSQELLFFYYAVSVSS